MVSGTQFLLLDQILRGTEWNLKSEVLVVKFCPHSDHCAASFGGDLKSRKVSMKYSISTVPWWEYGYQEPKDTRRTKPLILCSTRKISSWIGSLWSVIPAMLLTSYTSSIRKWCRRTFCRFSESLPAPNAPQCASKGFHQQCEPLLLGFQWFQNWTWQKVDPRREP